jgi:hypothetical protein
MIGMIESQSEVQNRESTTANAKYLQSTNQVSCLDSYDPEAKLSALEGDAGIGFKGY